MFARFTASGRRVVVLAQEESLALGHDRIGTEHLLLGLFHEESGAGSVALRSFGPTLADARAAVEAVVGPVEPMVRPHIPFTPRAKSVLELALRESIALEQSWVGSGHVLLGLIAEGEGRGVEVLGRLGISAAEARARALTAIAAAPEVSPAFAASLPNRRGVGRANARARRIAFELSDTRAAKDAAIDVGDLPGATAMRQREKELLAEYTQLVVDLGHHQDPVEPQE